MNLKKGDLIEFHNNFKLCLYINDDLIILLFDLKRNYIILNLNQFFYYNNIDYIKNNNILINNFNKLKYNKINYNIYNLSKIEKEKFMINFYKICKLLKILKEGDIIYATGFLSLFNINLIIHTMLFKSFKTCSIIHKTKLSKNSIKEFLLNLFNIQKENSGKIEERSLFEMLLKRKYFTLYNSDNNKFIINEKNNNQDVIKKADEKIGKETKYNIFNDNCQTFISDCKYNNNITFQFDIISISLIIYLWIFILFIIIINKLINKIN